MSKKLGLVVDDSKVVRKFGRRILEGRGFRVEEATDGQDALEKASKNKPDLILLDWNMPIMDGITFLRKYREVPANHSTIVIFCTTENDASHMQEGMSAGASEYVMKPFDDEIIKTKLVQTGLMEV